MVSESGPVPLGWSDHAAFLADCLDGLAGPQKSLPCKWLYDAVGSQLFEEICSLPEYYPSRTEIRLLERALPALAEAIGYGTTLVELGSGASRKTRALLDALPGISSYVPIDISAVELDRAAREICDYYLGLEVHPLCADFSELDGLGLNRIEGSVLVFFPGSTIGNMTPADATMFLDDLRKALPPGALFLLGIDLIKDPNILVAAYDDAAGVTAAFNLNILTRINRELNGMIDVDAFDHRAIWNAGESRIEMHLVSTRSQDLRIGSHVFSMIEGETIHTENSHKLPAERLVSIFHDAGWSVDREWSEKDPSYLFCLLRAG